MESQDLRAQDSPGAAPADSTGGPTVIEWDRPPEGPSGTNKTLMIIAGAALVISSVGMVRSMMSPKQAVAEASSVAPTDTVFGERLKMMREAMSLAKDAQALQRERMEMTMREIQASEEGYGGGDSGPGDGLYQELNGGR